MSGQAFRVMAWLVFGTLLASGVAVSGFAPQAVAQGGNSPPGVEIREPSNGDIVSGVIDIWMCAWDPDGNEQIELVQVSIDHGDWENATYDSLDHECSWWVYEWNTTTVEDGWHYIAAAATDGERWADDAIEVFVRNHDWNHPPGVEIREPNDGDIVSGVVEIWVCAWDPDGNEKIEVVKVRIDAGAWHEATFVNVTDECSWWVYEWNTTTVEDGWHLIKVAATDGELWADDAIEVFVRNHPENHPPRVEIVEPRKGETVDGVVVVWVCAWDPDGNEDVERVWVRIDNGGWENATFDSIEGECSWWFYEWDTTTVEDGEHHIWAIAWDGQAHSDEYRIWVFVKNHTNHRPGIEIVKPKSGDTVGGVVEILMCAWDPDGNEQIEAVWVRIDHGEKRLATFVEVDADCSWWVYEWDTTTVENGWHRVGAITTDGELWEDTAIEVFVHNDGENHSPRVEIVRPKHGSTVSGTVEIHMCAWDPDGNDDIRMVWVQIDNGDKHEAAFIKTTADCSWWVYEWDTTAVDDGWHAVKAIVWDGQDDGSHTIEVLVDNVPDDRPPEVRIIHPRNGSKVDGIVLIHGEAFDDHGVESVFVRIDNGKWHKVIDTSPDGSWRTWALQWDTTTVDNGEHVIWAKAWDGNQHSEPDRVEVIVDNHILMGFITSAEGPLSAGMSAAFLLGLAGTFRQRKGLLARR